MHLKDDEIEKFIIDHDNDAKAIKEDLLKICWYMRGSISYADAHLLELEDRKIIAKIIEDNLSTTKETGLPFF